MDLLRSIYRHALRHPRKIAIVDDRREYSYLRVLAGSMFLAKHIREQSSAKHVGLMLPTSGGMPLAILGAWQAGRVPVPLNYLLGKDELSYVIQHSGIDTIFSVQPMLDFIGGREVLPANVKVVKLEDLSFKGLPPIRWPRRVSDDELAVLIYTSGTSGKPKGVMLSHGNLRSNAHGGIESAKIGPDEVLLGVLPQFHSFGLTALTLCPLVAGAKVVYTARFVPKKIVELMRQHRPGIFMAVPSMYNALLSLKDLDKADFASIRMPISGGEPLPATVAEGCGEKLGLEMLEGYGLTETSPVISWSTPEGRRAGSVGRVLAGVGVRLVDEQDAPVKDGESGEILVTGPNVMQGYYLDPEATDAAFVTIDGKRYLRTGDIGRIDADGYLFITGRKKEMMIIGGMNVFPRSIEECLSRHPAVRASGVIGQPDDSRGEVPVAFVEMNDDHKTDPPQQVERELRGWCREHLAAYKVPRQVIVVESLPRSPTGKVLRRKLAELIPGTSAADAPSQAVSAAADRA